MASMSSFFDGAFSSSNKVIERIKQNGSSIDLRKEQQKLYEQLGSLVYKEAKTNPEPYERFGSIIDLLDEIEKKISLIENPPKQPESVASGSASKVTTIDAGLTCPSCGNSVSKGDKFCMECGKSLEGIKPEKKRTCSQCNMPVDEDARFCEGCGARLTNTQDETKPALQSDVEALDYSERFEDTIEFSLVQGDKSSEVANEVVISQAEATASQQANSQEDVEEGDIKETTPLESEQVNVDKQKPAVRYCPQCGSAIKEGWKFCGSCGAIQG